MGKTCVAPNCNNKFEKGTLTPSLHRFPLHNEILLKQWVLAVNRKDFVPNQNSFLCSDHFTRDDFVTRYKANAKPRLKTNVVPSIFNYAHVDPEKKPPAKKRKIAPQKQTVLGHIVYDNANGRSEVSQSTMILESILSNNVVSDNNVAFISPSPNGQHYILLNAKNEGNSTEVISTANVDDMNTANENSEHSPNGQQYVLLSEKNEANFADVNCLADIEDANTTIESSEEPIQKAEHSYANFSDKKPDVAPENTTDLKRKVVSLQQKINRLEKRWENLSKQINQLKNDSVISEDAWKILSKNFVGVRRKEKQREVDAYCRNLLKKWKQENKEISKKSPKNNVPTVIPI